MKRRSLIWTLPVLLLAFRAHGRATDASFVSPSEAVTTAAGASSSELRASGAQLRLCECERATGAPNGLGCSKEGWFISNFENYGTWMGGGGLVPLSHAVCCRPCLPDELPAEAAAVLPPNTTAVSIVSIGCHPSSGKAYKALQCEGSGSSFVSGFSNAERVSAFYADTYYPVGQTECCTPAVLLSTGDVWELTRCDCDLVQGKDCGAQDSNRLLWGFASWRLTSRGMYLPVAPMECCGVCLASQMHGPATDCADLNFCSGSGICQLGACECYDGYGGPDCSETAGSRDVIPSWLVWTASLMGAVMLLAASAAVRSGVITRYARMLAQRQQPDASLPLQQPLLVSLDEEGSVGSIDTEGEVGLDDTDDEDGAPRTLLPRLEGLFNSDDNGMSGPRITGQSGGQGRLVQHGSVELLTTNSRRRNEQRSPQAGDVEAADDGADADTESETDEPQAEQHVQQAGSGAAAAVAAAGAAVAAVPVPAVQPAAAAAGSSTELSDVKKPSSMLGGAEGAAVPSTGVCSVCMTRPVQVALVPCGHTNLCRRCSRRVDRCPFCRREIVRRQRLYYSSA